jgi:hypothetical protein
MSGFVIAAMMNDGVEAWNRWLISGNVFPAVQGKWLGGIQSF